MSILWWRAFGPRRASAAVKPESAVCQQLEAYLSQMRHAECEHAIFAKRVKIGEKISLGSHNVH